MSVDPAIQPAAPAQPHPAIRGGLRGRLHDSLTDPGQMLAIVLIVALVARAAWLAVPNALVFDEAYYVNAARILLGIQLDPGAHYAGSPFGLDPNTARWSWPCRCSSSGTTASAGGSRAS
jgi:hypothetical protein